jgi:hypothetical protein
LAIQSAFIQARPRVTVGVAKGVAKGMPMHIVQRVNFDDLIPRRLRSVSTMY